MRRVRKVLPENRFTLVLHAVVDITTLACGWWLLAFSAVTCLEILGRKFFGFSLQGVDEIGSYTYAIVTGFGLSYALLCAGHTRVDFLLSRFSTRMRALLNAFAMVSLAAMAAFAAYRAAHVLADSRALASTAPTPLATPLWWPQSIWLVAFVLFAIVTVYAAAHACLLLAQGHWRAVNAHYGPQTLDEEIAAETAREESAR